MCSTDNYNDTPPCYAPVNYDGDFRGPMTFTTALAQSINVPAVKVLYLSGIPAVLNLAKSLALLLSVILHSTVYLSRLALRT